ncbi:hypothetical protein BDFB_014696 [Asbolus verrucosus]|uniref:Uncharacterized protein n=1 Tax=Asbolus verrucosus TaxID=1661398 RepID=A0A482VIX5_ASBVE|nr:hypothetical protein BDFB_014696 [Asbolus verrucosus]
MSAPQVHPRRSIATVALALVAVGRAPEGLA